MADIDNAVETLVEKIVDKLGKSSSTTAKSETFKDDPRAAAKAVESVNEAYEKQKRLTEEIYTGQKRADELRDLQVKAARENVQLLTSALKSENAIGDTRKELIELIKQENKKIEEQIGLVSKLKKELASSAKEMATNFINLEKILIKPKMVVDILQEFDKVEASFVRSTSAGRKFRDEIIKTQNEGAKLGVTFEEAGRIQESVYKNLTGFAVQTDKKFLESMNNTAAQMSRLGLSFDGFFKTTSKVSNVLGKSQKDAAGLQKQFVALGMGTGVSLEQVNTNLTSNMNTLSLYGREAVGQFTKFQQVAAAAGVELGTLTDLTEKLTSFESTGQFAGRFNALAGSDIFDVAQLATLEGSEKLEYLIRGFQSSGLNFDDPKMMRAALQATGIDASTFKSLMNLDPARLSAMVKKTDAGGNVDIAKLAAEGETATNKVVAQQQSKSFNETAFEMYLGTNSVLFQAVDKIPGAIIVLATAVGGLAATLLKNKISDMLLQRVSTGIAAQTATTATGITSAGVAGTGIAAGLAGVAGVAAAGLGGWGIGRLIGEAGLDDIIQSRLTPAEYTYKKAQSVEDGAIVNGRPVIAAAGQLLRGTSTDIPMLFDPTKASNEGNNNNELIRAINNLASRPISIQIDGREIAKAASREFTPRMIG